LQRNTKQKARGFYDSLLQLLCFDTGLLYHDSKTLWPIYIESNALERERVKEVKANKIEGKKGRVFLVALKSGKKC
jgi:hypothetical protein